MRTQQPYEGVLFAQLYVYQGIPEFKGLTELKECKCELKFWKVCNSYLLYRRNFRACSLAILASIFKYFNFKLLWNVLHRIFTLAFFIESQPMKKATKTIVLKTLNIFIEVEHLWSRNILECTFEKAMVAVS